MSAPAFSSFSIARRCLAWSAFCAWDGGRLQTWEENSTAFGPGAYPWGNAPAAGGFSLVNQVWTQVGPARATVRSSTRRSSRGSPAMSPIMADDGAPLPGGAADDEGSPRV